MLQEHWTYDELDKKSVLMERWTHQFAHTWTHFAFWVPFIRFIESMVSTTVFTAPP